MVSVLFKILTRLKSALDFFPRVFKAASLRSRPSQRRLYPKNFVMQHQKASSDPSSKSTSTVLSTTQDVVPMSELPQMTPIRSVKATGCLKSANTCKISSKCPTSSSLKATSKKVSFALKNESVDSIRSIKPNRTTIKVTTWSLPDEEKYMIL